MKTRIIIIVFIVFAVMHQDIWNWNDGHLVFGFIPVGLAYHAGYSLVAVVFWSLIVKFAWPTDLEKWAEGSDSD